MLRNDDFNGVLVDRHGDAGRCLLRYNDTGTDDDDNRRAFPEVCDVCRPSCRSRWGGWIPHSALYYLEMLLRRPGVNNTRQQWGDFKKKLYVLYLCIGEKSSKHM